MDDCIQCSGQGDNFWLLVEDAQEVKIVSTKAFLCVT
jgi:hypothetical protein